MHYSLTDVPDLRVGHAQDAEAITGCTVILTMQGAVCGVDVRGGGPSTRETDLLNPASSINHVHGIVLCGGSAFGQAAVVGVMSWMHQNGIGHRVGNVRVPIVPAAVIFDLAIGQPDRWPDAEMGYAACASAGTTVAEGCVGVGMGATVGKLLGPRTAMKSGVGTWSETLVDGTVVGALVVCNAFGDVWHQGKILAGVRDRTNGGFADAMKLMREERIQRMLKTQQSSSPTDMVSNTTLAVVATNAALTKAEATRMAQMAQDAFPRAIRPIHTPFDGDTVFALSTGQHPAPHLTILGSVAADVLKHAIIRSITQAVSIAGVPAVAASGGA